MFDLQIWSVKSTFIRLLMGTRCFFHHLWPLTQSWLFSWNWNRPVGPRLSLCTVIVSLCLALCWNFVEAFLAQSSRALAEIAVFRRVGHCWSESPPGCWNTVWTVALVESAFTLTQSSYLLPAGVSSYINLAVLALAVFSSIFRLYLLLWSVPAKFFSAFKVPAGFLYGACVFVCACWDQQVLPLLRRAVCRNHGYINWFFKQCGA